MTDVGDADIKQIVGRQAVREALRADTPLTWLRIARGTRGPLIAEIEAMAQAAGVTVYQVDRRDLDRQAGGRHHQGVLAGYSGFTYSNVPSMLARARKLGQDPFFLLAAGVVDPQNLGSLIRTAEAAGVHGLILPKHRSATVTASVIRASAGAVMHLPVAVVNNLARQMRELKEAGLWFVAADPRSDASLFATNLRGPLGVVVGGEGRGIPRLVKDLCDFHVSIPMYGAISSLNAGVAGALMLYEVVRQRRQYGDSTS